MNENDTQLDSHGGLEAESKPVAQKLGLLDKDSLSELLKSSFLNEEEAPPAQQGQQEEELESPEASSEDVQDESDESESDTADESTLNRGVQKRINKLVAARKSAEAKLEEQRLKLEKLENELETTRNSTPSKEVNVSDFVNSLNTQDEIRKAYRDSVEVLLWCERNPNGGTIDFKGKQVELDMDEVLEMKHSAMRRKEIELPERAQYVQTHEQAENQVKLDFAWWDKPETEEYKAAQMVLKEFPELKKRRADYKHVAGLVVLGMRSYMEMKSKKTAPAPIKKAPPQPGVRGLPAKTSGDDLRSAKQKFAARNSDRDAVTDYVKAMGFV